MIEPPEIMFNMESASCKGQNFEFFKIYIPSICWKVMVVSIHYKVLAIFYFLLHHTMRELWFWSPSDLGPYLSLPSNY